VDKAGRLVGVVSLRELVISPLERRIGDIMYTDVILVRADEDQESAARLMARYDLLALPVVDPEDRLIGVITHDDLVDVLEEEATEDMYRLVGVNESQRADDPVGVSVRRRLPWLLLNLGPQLVLVGALKFFEPTIARVAALAVLFPLVTGQGGNVGSQTTTIIVRSLALGEIEHRQLRLLAKESAIGLVNGLTVGIAAGIIAYLVTAESSISALIAGTMVLAMTLNLAAGALVGTLVPLTLRRAGLDPAVASSVFVTTATDTMGVVFFLGLFVLLNR
jgi:magnesium transporter